MRVAVIYRNREAAPPDQLPTLLQGLGEWLQSYGNRGEMLEFFVGGGGVAILDMQDSAELMTMVAENPFTPYSDVEIRPVVAAETAMRQLQEVFGPAEG
jgi:hypothetical protein